ncbi:MAG: alpha/beta hydrolase [Hyphomicrobiaceae bacterium]
MTASRLTLPDGAELAISVDGAGPDLMLVTGLGGTAAFWDPTIPALSQHFRVIRFDQRGIAASTRGTAHTDIALLGRDANAVLDHVGSKRCLLLGHSTGGVILQSMALDSEARISGLILSGTWARPNRYMAELFGSRLKILAVTPREYSAMVGFLGFTADWLNANWDKFELMQATAPMTPAQQAVVVERIHAILEFDRAKDVHKITVPTLVQGAEDDLIVPQFLNRELAGLLKHAELQMFPTGGHMYPITRTDAFVAAIVKFASKCKG